jgi:hypothetical protein
MTRPIFNAASDHYQREPFALVELMMYADLYNASYIRRGGVDAVSAVFMNGKKYNGHRH